MYAPITSTPVNYLSIQVLCIVSTLSDTDNQSKYCELT